MVESSSSSRSRADAHPELETETLRLINLIGYSAHGRTFARRFERATGISLPGSDLRALIALRPAPPAPIGELSAELGIDLGQLSRQVATLVEEGLALREPDSADRRRMLVGLTDEGARLVQRWRRSWVQDYLDPVRDRNPDQLAALAEWLDHVADRLAEALDTQDSGLGLPAGWQRAAKISDPDPALKDYLRAVVRLAEIVGRSHGFDDMLSAVDAPVRQHSWVTLRLISTHGPLAVSDLAARMDIDVPRASKRLRALRELGLVHRRPSEQDRRVGVIEVTPVGADLIRHVEEFQLKGFRQTLGPITRADRTRWTPPLTTLVTRLAAPATTQR
ncbi:MarR family transcriptional regulator [Saccharopolyspora gregorii]|uniref:MarR family transcriptional regulator n=1 Tax=Saccharopolyspora gregorii TaxID=33914 RepID=UPI0021ABE501|nr:MarR family transcriptional regulator [Saccharopolyspora gregorii]